MLKLFTILVNKLQKVSLYSHIKNSIHIQTYNE